MLINTIVAVLRVKVALTAPDGDCEAAGCGEETEFVLVYGRVNRCALLFPVGDEFVEGVRLDDGTGEDVAPDFGRFLDDAYANVFAVLLGELFGTDCGTEARRTTADD